MPSYALDYAKGNGYFCMGGSCFWSSIPKWFQIVMLAELTWVLKELTGFMILKLAKSINS